MKLEFLKSYDMAKLLEIEDPTIIKDYIREDKGSWIQFLSQELSLEGSDISVAGVFNEERTKIKLYIVLVNDVNPPVHNRLIIWYAWSSLNHYESKKIYGQLKEWAVQQKYDKISIYTKQSELMAKFGFQPTGFVEMEEVLNG